LVSIQAYSLCNLSDFWKTTAETVVPILSLGTVPGDSALVCAEEEEEEILRNRLKHGVNSKAHQNATIV
jgi:hypothetical protein